MDGKPKRTPSAPDRAGLALPPLDPDAEPTPEELAAAGALRDALEDAARPDPLADFARAAALAHAPRPLEPDAHRAILEQAIARGEARRTQARRRWTRVAFGGAAGALAMAATALLWVSTSMRPQSAAAPVVQAAIAAEPLAPLRSTQSLFREPFARAGGASARIDRIALARGSDLRDNRFAAWGVR
ncbi:MAG TPA: hypothetical protein VGI39_25350 [Polyangiaceae bacterium]|jgi:hypothetical protein